MQINGSQGFALASQVLHYLSHTSSPSFFGYFLRSVFPIFYFCFYFDLDWPGPNPPNLSFPSTSDDRQWSLVPGSVWHFHTSMSCTLITNTFLHTPLTLLLVLFLSSHSPYTFMSFKIVVTCHIKTM
jgi:hypothetical protein